MSNGVTMSIGATMSRWTRTAIALCLFVVLSGADVLAQDTITLQRSTRRGSKLVGTIMEVSPTEITINSSGTERKIPVNEVQRISLGNEPAGLRQARTAILSGQYEQASAALAEVELPASASAILKQELAYYRTLAVANLALHGGGNPEEAAQQMMDFIRQDRNTYHFFEAVEVLGRLAQAGGSHENAARYFQQLAKAPWPEYTLRSSVLIGAALQAQGKFAEAQAQYQKALAVTADSPSVVRQQTLAQIGIAGCQAEMGETELAIKSLEDIIAKHDPADEELFAQAYLALGSCYRKAEQALDAVLAYLHIDLLFYNQRDAHAEALYHLSLLWPQVEEPARGVDARQLLQSRYAGSVWAKRAG